jgi:hypothetical protein
VFIILGMGMGSVQYTLILFNLVRERLPSVSRPVLVLPRRQGLLLFRGRRRTGLRLGLVYLGLRGGKARFRLDVELDGKVHRLERATATSGSWEILGENGDEDLLDGLPGLRNRADNRNFQLSLEILEADEQRVRVRVTSSMRPTYREDRDVAGFDLAGVFELSDVGAGLVGWMVRQGGASLAEAAEYTDQTESETRMLLSELEEKGYVVERADAEGGPRYEARLATRRGRRGAQQLWQSLAEEDQTPDAETLRPSRASGISALWRRISSSKGGNFLLGASPVVVAFLMAEWLLFRGSGSFTGLLGLIGVIIVPLLGGIFPVLLIVASRRQGERVPTAVYRFLGNPVFLVFVYGLFLASIFLHGLLIWTNPLERILAVATSVLVVVMTLAMRKSFTRRTVVELRKEERDDGEQGFFSITTAGRSGTADVRLEYPEREETYEAASGEVPAFSSLRRATFQTEGGAGVLKVWAHRVTPEGNSVPLAGLLDVRQGDDTRQFDLEISDGYVILPIAQEACRVDITFARTDEVNPLDRLL